MHNVGTLSAEHKASPTHVDALRLLGILRYNQAMRLDNSKYVSTDSETAKKRGKCHQIPMGPAYNQRCPFPTRFVEEVSKKCNQANSIRG